MDSPGLARPDPDTHPQHRTRPTPTARGMTNPDVTGPGGIRRGRLSGTPSARREKLSPHGSSCVVGHQRQFPAERVPRSPHPRSAEPLDAGQAWSRWRQPKGRQRNRSDAAVSCYGAGYGRQDEHEFVPEGTVAANHPSKMTPGATVSSGAPKACLKPAHLRIHQNPATPHTTHPYSTRHDESGCYRSRWDP